MLLLALENSKYRWLGFNTSALVSHIRSWLFDTLAKARQYFFEFPPSLTRVLEWEAFLFQLFDADRLSISKLAVLMNDLPSALANVEADFSAVSGCFNVQYRNPDDVEYELFVSVPERFVVSIVHYRTC
jgi:hypothetical protein